MASPNCTNTDISGIGIRTATYAQNLLSFVPAVVSLVNDGKISDKELAFMEDQSTNILLTAFGLLISSFIQASTAQGLDNYHLTLVLNLSWMNNTNLFIYSLLRIHRRIWQRPRDRWSWREIGQLFFRSSDAKRIAAVAKVTAKANMTAEVPALALVSSVRRSLSWVNMATIIGSLHLSFMGALGVWLWSDPTGFGISDTCPTGATATVIGRTFSIGSPGLRLVSLIIFSAVLIPIVNLILPTALVLLPYFLSMMLPWPASGDSEGSVNNRKGWKSRSPREQAAVISVAGGLAILFAINVTFLIDTELSIARNEPRQEGQDNIWTPRQTLALLLLVLPMKSLAQYTFASVGIPLFVGKQMGEALRGLREYKKDVPDPWDEFRKWMWIVEDTPVRVDDKWLEAASKERHIDIVCFLLENGAHVESMEDSGTTFIHSAAKDGRAGVVRLLGEYGADVDERAPVHIAAMNGHVEVVHAIARLGGDMNAPVPVHIAARNGHVEAVRTMARLGGDVNAPNLGSRSSRG